MPEEYIRSLLSDQPAAVTIRLPPGDALHHSALLTLLLAGWRRGIVISYALAGGLLTMQRGLFTCEIEPDMMRTFRDFSGVRQLLLRNGVARLVLRKQDPPPAQILEAIRHRLPANTDVQLTRTRIVLSLGPTDGRATAGQRRWSVGTLNAWDAQNTPPNI